MLDMLNYPTLFRPNKKHISNKSSAKVLKKWKRSNIKSDIEIAREIFNESSSCYKYLFIDCANELVFLLQEPPEISMGLVLPPTTSTLTIKTDRVFLLQRNTIYIKD